METINIDKLKIELCNYGTPLLVKAGVVFTLLMKGEKINNWENLNLIQKIVLNHVQDIYPKVEAMHVDSDILLMVLK